MKNKDYELFGKNYLKAFVEHYRYLINKVYKYPFESSPDAFPTYNFLEYLDVKVVLLDKDFFTLNVCIIIFDNSKDNESQFVDCRDLDSREISKIYSSVNPFNSYEDFLRAQFPWIDKKKIKIFDSDTDTYINFIKSDLKSFADSRASQTLKNEFEAYTKHASTIVTQYKHDTISPFSHLDFDGLIAKIGDKDFEYQMRQAEECYKRSLYLPAAATMGVCLETVLLLLIEKNDIPEKNIQQTMLNALGTVLRSKNIINYRTNRRIEMAYSIRNSVSHSNTGSVAKTDCDLILNTIKSIVDEHF